MPVHLRSIGTALPPTVLSQRHVREVFARQPDLSRLGRRLVGAVFDAAAIETRHTVLDELAEPDPAEAVAALDEGGERDVDVPAVYVDRASGDILTPGTGTRNATYVERAPALFEGAARDALAGAGGLGPDDVTHVVTVSCTGFFAPGPDYALVRALGLSPATQRYHLGFMGCYGAFPALRAARDFCTADPDAVVLVVCAELCTLHLHSASDPDTIVANSVFADGAAAAVVTARPAPEGATVLDLDAFETVLTPVGEGDMAWTIGDQGFDMVLSSYVPHIIEEHVDGALAPLLAREPALDGHAAAEVEHWAVHPGGRSNLDRVQSQLGLSSAQMAPSRGVLRDQGNMSSATVLFVLRRVLEQGGETPAGAASAGDAPAGDAPATAASAGDVGPEAPAAPAPHAGPGAGRVCALAFGPGLTVESALLTRRTA